MQINGKEQKHGYKWISTTHGMSGHFAVMYWINGDCPELGEFVEPWETGHGRYATKDEASEEAQFWAALEDLEYVPE